MFTDEFHVNLASMGALYILREQGPGKRTTVENIQERLQKEGNALHVAGWVMYITRSARGY
jgi:hypothetical protein